MVGCEKGHDQLKTRFPEIYPGTITLRCNANRGRILGMGAAWLGLRAHLLRQNKGPCNAWLRERVILSTAHADDQLIYVAYFNFIKLKVKLNACMRKKTYVNKNCVSVYYQTQRNCAAKLSWTRLFSPNPTTTPHPNPTKQRPLQGCARE